RWAAAVDCVGSRTLATVLSQMRYGGVVAACGLAQGADLPTTVMPFILRGVTPVGIDSVQAPMERRRLAWQGRARALDSSKLAAMTSVIPRAGVPAAGAGLLAGKLRGRVVVDVRA